MVRKKRRHLTQTTSFHLKTHQGGAGNITEVIHLAVYNFSKTNHLRLKISYNLKGITKSLFGTQFPKYHMLQVKKKVLRISFVL